MTSNWWPFRINSPARDKRPAVWPFRLRLLLLWLWKRTVLSRLTLPYTTPTRIGIHEICPDLIPHVFRTDKNPKHSSPSTQSCRKKRRREKKPNPALIDSRLDGVNDTARSQTRVFYFFLLELHLKIIVLVNSNYLVRPACIPDAAGGFVPAQKITKKKTFLLVFWWIASWHSVDELWN